MSDTTTLDAPTLTPEQQDELDAIVNGPGAVRCTFGNDDPDEPPCLKTATWRHVCHCGHVETLCSEHYALVGSLGAFRITPACKGCYCPVRASDFYPI